MWEGGEGRLRVPTFDPHTINACWFLFLSFAYLLVAEAASFDKKELCRSDTPAFQNAFLTIVCMVSVHFDRPIAYLKFILHLKIQIVVTLKSDQDPDPHCFASLDWDPH